jgi:hypothetical protein
MLRSESTAPAILVVAVLLSYFNALGGVFQFDDYNVIVNNPDVHSLAAWRDSMPGIRALLKLSYALNWAMDARPFGFHLFNVLVHAINTVLVYRVLLALRKESVGPHLAALVGAMLFALHPVQTEAVSYVSGRSVSLMALFYLGAVLAWLRADRTARPQPWRALSAGAIRCRAAGEGNRSHAAARLAASGCCPPPASVHGGADVAPPDLARSGFDLRIDCDGRQPDLSPFARRKSSPLVA